MYFTSNILLEIKINKKYFLDGCQGYVNSTGEIEEVVFIFHYLIEY